ncbi:MAG: universal stress protein [Desulfobacterota bacterium]|nr:universal stress protein [Thermodesulfobacteriota bacterium]
MQQTKLKKSNSVGRTYMIKSILLPTDGSPNSKTAVQYGIYCAELFDAEIIGLHVIDIRALEGPFLSDISGSLGFSPYQNYLPKFQEILERRADLILEEFQRQCSEKNIVPRLKKHIGIIANIIADEAKKTDLVVIAQHGEHEKWSSGLLGSTSESVVRKSPRPVLVTPGIFRTFSRILIAYDGGIESNKALKIACELFSGKTFSLNAVYVTNNDERADELQTEIEEFSNPYKIEMQYTRLQGDAGREILAYATAHNIDLIIMGAFSHSRIHDLILGGTTAYILRRSPIPVLLTR